MRNFPLWCLPSEDFVVPSVGSRSVLTFIYFCPDCSSFGSGLLGLTWLSFDTPHLTLSTFWVCAVLWISLVSSAAVQTRWGLGHLLQTAFSAPSFPPPSPPVRARALCHAVVQVPSLLCSFTSPSPPLSFVLAVMPICFLVPLMNTLPKDPSAVHRK